MNTITVGDKASSNKLFKPYFDLMGKKCSFTGLALCEDGSAIYLHLIPRVTEYEKKNFMHSAVRFFNSTVGTDNLNLTLIRGALLNDFIFTCPFNKSTADNAFHDHNITMFLVDTESDTIEAIRVISVNDKLKDIIQDQYNKIHDNQISDIELSMYAETYIVPYSPKELEKRSTYLCRDGGSMCVEHLLYLD